MLRTKKGKINPNLTKNGGEKLKREHPELHQDILNYTNDITHYYNSKGPQSVTLKHRIEWYLDGINKCPTCNVVIESSSNFCSQKCAANSLDVQSKRTQSRLNKGKWFKEKPSWGIATEEGREKAVEKRRKTGSYQDSAKKAQQTMLERYGCNLAVKNSKKTLKERYGVSNPYQIESVRSKLSESAKYRNVEKVDELLYNDSWLLDNLKRKGRTWVQDNYPCSDNFIRIRELEIGYRSKRETSAEVELSDFLSSNNISHKLRTRKIIQPLELDLYIPDTKVAIEYDGLYWHSADSKQSEMTLKERLLTKERMCNERGITLLRVSELEWTDRIKKDIWKSMILSKVDRSSFVKIHGRKCTEVSVSPSNAKEFFENNHLQSHIQGKYKGLEYNGELVAVVSYSTPRFTDNADIEILRFATKNFYTVNGAYSKLTKEFNNIISYANKNWSTGKLYSRYEKISETDYNYVWIKSGKVYSRYQLMKHKLGDIGDITADEWLYTNGYRKVIRSGNISFVYK